MGHVLNYTLGDVVTHFRRRSGSRGAAADGFRLVRTARRERRHPRGRPSARDHRAEHRDDPQPDAQDGLGDRLAARGLGARADLLPLDAVALPEVLRARARVPQGGARSTGARTTRPCSRTSTSSTAVLAVRRRRRGAEHGAVVLQDHRVRRPAARRPGDDRLAGAHEEDPDELDRPLRGRRGAVPRRGARHRHPGLHDASRHAVRRDVLRRRAGVAARRPAGRGDGARRRGALRTRASPRRARPRSASSARRPACSPAATRRTPSTASGSRSGSPTTC